MTIVIVTMMSDESPQDKWYLNPLKYFLIICFSTNDDQRIYKFVGKYWKYLLLIGYYNYLRVSCLEIPIQHMRAYFQRSCLFSNKWLCHSFISAIKMKLSHAFVCRRFLIYMLFPEPQNKCNHIHNLSYPTFFCFYQIVKLCDLAVVTSNKCTICIISKYLGPKQPCNIHWFNTNIRTL